MQNQIIVIKPKSLSAKDKYKLSKKGYTVIECADHVGGLQFKQQKETVEYEILNCANCGERMHITVERVAALRKSGRSFYCSHGHGQSFTTK